MSPFVWHNYIITATLATSFPHDSLSQTLPLLIFISQSKLEQNSRDIFVVELASPLLFLSLIYCHAPLNVQQDPLLALIEYLCSLPKASYLGKLNRKIIHSPESAVHFQVKN